MEWEKGLNQLIYDIIEARKNKVEKLKVRKEELISVRQHLEELKIRGDNAIAAKDENFRQLFECNPGLKEQLEDPSYFEKSISAYQDAIEELEHLIKRFDRKSVNISVVGDSKAGKSKFLQTVSGLGDECIPSFPGSFCTGVSSIIENNDKIEGVKGVFTFKTEGEILREVNHKLKSMTGGKVQVSSLNGLQGLTAATIRQNLVTISEEGNIPAFIEMYVENFYEWAPLVKLTVDDEEEMEHYHLKAGDSQKREYICTDSPEIQKYVAKHDGGTVEAGGTDAIPLYRYIAVKNAVIYSHFALTSVNRIRLIDTVGLGDTAVGTTKKMYEAIDRDSDAVLYFFRPEANKGGVIDERTYHILNYELYPRYKDENMKWWMAVVVNHINGETAQYKDNLNECKKFLEGFVTSAPKMAQNVVFKETIDVSKPDEVSEKCIIPLLESISKHLGEIDRRFEAKTREKIEAANKSFCNLKENFSEIRVPASKDIIDNQFRNIFSGFIKQIEELKKNYSEEGATLKDTFLEESLNKVSSLKESGEENQQTETTLSIYQSLDYMVETDSRRIRAFGELQRIVRNIGSRDSEELNKVEKKFKAKLAELFLDNFVFDRSKCPEPDSSRFFLDMAEQLFGARKDLIMLKDAFLSVHSFRLDETKGMTKLLFNDNAERYLNCWNYSPMDKKTPVAEKISPPTKGIAFANYTMPKVEKTTKEEEKKSDIENSLVEEMNHRLTQFIESVKSSELYRDSEIVPLSRQIVSEIKYFLRFFDVCYHREWATVLNQQLKEGYIFTKEKQEIDNLSEMFDEFKRVIDRAVVHAEVPQNI